ncbi:MAG TPA: chemotaxis protein CheB [Paucimonas sp.]|nr:chemotaxis protein CheB [Paucimonas sp.]
MRQPSSPSPVSAASAARRIDAVVLGASAGGVAAIGTLLGALPAGFEAAIVVVVHLPPTGGTSLQHVFSSHCVLPIQEAEDKECIEPGRIYLAPPDYHLLVEPDKTLSLSGDAPVNYSRPSIDVLFESAAFAYRDSLLGIVLTGASADGAAGLAAIRACGGLAWVQSPDEATAKMMPEAAIARAGADLVAPVHEIATRLARLRDALHE